LSIKQSSDNSPIGIVTGPRTVDGATARLYRPARPPDGRVVDEKECHVPRRIIALGVAALATAGSGVGAILAAAAPAATHASCLSTFESQTSVNRQDNGPSAVVNLNEIDVKPGTPLLLATNESQYTFLFLDCVAANPANGQ
jgi:hypothetical protein